MAATLLTTAVASGYEMHEDFVVKMWNNTTAPHSNGVTTTQSEDKPYRIGNSCEAELFFYEADREKNCGKAVLICPGGAYRITSMDNEGYLMAQWFAKQGITAAVLKYRIPNGVKDVPFEDGVEALRVMRQRSRQLGYQPDQVGIVGFSAGGHLAASISVLAPNELKPNFSILFYPVISSEKGLAHEGSFNNLLGKERSAELSAEYSIEKRIDGDTPPAILFHCTDDKTVNPINSTLYFNALYPYKKHSALYIFPEGGHGWGNYDRGELQEQWQMLLLDWIGKLK